MTPESQAGYILLVEDDVAFAEELSQYLGAHGIFVIHVSSTEEAMEQILSEMPIGVILDQFVGATDTLAWLSDLRRRYQGGIMFLSANPEVTDRIVGLEMGAADFVSKTTLPREILARVRSLIRRSGERAPAASVPAAQLPTRRSPRPGHWFLDPTQMELFRPDGSLAQLTSAEFAIMRYLDSCRGRTVSRDELVEAILHRRYDPLDRSIDNLISRLRKKLDAFEHAGRLIKSVRGEGYVFVGFANAEAA